MQDAYISLSLEREGSMFHLVSAEPAGVRAGRVQPRKTKVRKIENCRFHFGSQIYVNRNTFL